MKKREPTSALREGDEVIVESFDGRIWREPNPLGDDSS